MIPAIGLLDEQIRRMLEYFLQHPDEDICVKELEKNCNIPHTTAYKRIKELLEKGLIQKSKKVYKTQFYRLNKEDDIVKALLKEIKIVAGGDTIVFNEEILRGIKIVMSTFMRSKNKLINSMSLSDVTMVLLLIGMQSDVKENDPRMELIRKYIKKKKIVLDDAWLEKLAKKIARAMWLK